MTTGDEDTSYESAAEALRKNIQKYRHSGRQSGRIFDIQKELGELSLTKSQLKNELTLLSSVQHELSELEKESASLDAEEKKIPQNAACGKENGRTPQAAKAERA